MSGRLGRLGEKGGLAGASPVEKPTGRALSPLRGQNGTDEPRVLRGSQVCVRPLAGETGDRRPPLASLPGHGRISPPCAAFRGRYSALAISLGFVGSVDAFWRLKGSCRLRGRTAKVVSPSGSLSLANLVDLV